jgi:phenylacetate-CoA ligase
MMGGFLSLLIDYRRTMAAQWWPRRELEPLRQQRLSAVAVHACRTVHYYRQLFEEAGIRPQELESMADLALLPVSTKAKLREHALARRLAEGIAVHSLRSEKSSGSTGTPFTVYFDRKYYRTRSLIFLRALQSTGYQPGQRLLLVTDSASRRPRRWLNWHHASIEDSPSQLAEIYGRIRPHVLYGCTTALRLLAESLGTVPPWQPRVVITTAEGLDSATRNLLASVFRAGIHDFYGLSEMGLIAWQCPAAKGYHLAEDLVMAEFLPIAGSSGLCRLVLTNLEQQVMPFIRYDTGDLCVPVNQPCSCGRTFSLVDRFEGREVDCIIRADGTRLSPYRITCELEKLDGLQRFQLRQEELNTFTLVLENPTSNRHVLAARAVACLHRLLGREAEVRVRMMPTIAPEQGRKFRVVESRIAL